MKVHLDIPLKPESTILTTKVFNSILLREGKVLSPLNLSGFPSLNCKYASLKYVKTHANDYVRYVIDNIQLVGGYKYTLVDVKFQHIEKNKCPCIYGWHCDSVIDPFHPSKPETHHLFVSGKHCLTKFIAEPIELVVEPENTLRNFQKQIEEKYPSVRIREVPSNTIVSYGRFDFHSGKYAEETEDRLLIRITETDLIRPTK
jgi:hypothetical protein